jgi:ATP-binding cassette subfamily C protein CydD
LFDKELLGLPKIQLTFFILVVFSLCEALCIVGQAAGLSYGLVLLWQGRAISNAALPFALFGLSFFCVRLVLNAREAFIAKYAYSVVSNLRESLFDALFESGGYFVQQAGSATTSTMLVDGFEKLESYLKLVLPKISNMAVLSLLFTCSIALSDWVSGIVVVLLIPSMVLLMVLIGKTTASRGKDQHASFKIMSNHFIDSVRGLATLESFEISKTYASRVYEISERFRRATMKTLRTATLSGAVLDLFSTLAIAAVSIMLGLRLIDGSLELLPALFVLILVPECFKPIREFAADYHASLDGINSFRTISALLKTKPPQNEIVLLPSWNASSCLSIQHIAKNYGNFYALQDVFLDLNGYNKIGVIGKSGSGKSTLLRLLAGFEDPSQGCFGVDKTFELNTLRQPSWQNQIAYIPQNPYIFHATLKENLTFYNPQATETEILKVCDKLGLSELLKELPDGLNCVIGEGGRGLSGGQAQRVALARVLLDTSRKILLFDEPTAHLDIETEYELKQVMLEVMKDRLVVFATHRLHWINDFDFVVVLDAGRVCYSGKPSGLVGHPGLLTALNAESRGVSVVC